MADNNLEPFEMIVTSIDTMNKNLGDKENKERLNNNKEELYSIIDQTLSPYFQKKYAGRLVLNQHWKTSTNDQRQRFTKGLYESLVRSYALTLLNFDISQINVLTHLPLTNEVKKNYC